MIDLGLKAIWVNGTGDCEVTVVKLLGIGSDSRKYVAVAGSETGIPIDELAFLDFDGNYTHGLDVYEDAQGNLNLTE